MSEQPESGRVRTGRCFCGAVRLRIAAEPKTVRACWCRDCQYLGSGNATINVVFPTDAVSVTGELAAYESPADSGNAMRRRFCPSCGTQVFSNSDARPHLTVVRAGVMDEREDLAPWLTIWTASAPGWACFDPGTELVAGQPPPMT